MKKEDIVLPPGTRVPHHIAIIPDGNRRWARARGKPTFFGHKKGFDVAPKIARACRDFGVHTVTIWAFSTENWKRSKEEVDYLMKLYEKFVDDHLRDAMKENVKIVHLGRKDRIPKVLAKKMADAEEKTKANSKYIMNIALDYGGQDEVLRAIEKAQEDIASGKIGPEKLSEVAYVDENGNNHYYLENYLDTAGEPYPCPDLLIRTSREQRYSGFLMWQGAYVEYYWEPDHFPDFTKEKLAAAIIDWSGRERRFGGNGLTNNKIK